MFYKKYLIILTYILLYSFKSFRFAFLWNSEDNLLLLVLDCIVDQCGPLACCICNQAFHVDRCLEVVKVLSESLLQVSQTGWLKAWEARVEHELSEVAYLISMLSDSKEALYDASYKELISLCLSTSQNVDELLCQLEVG